MHMKGTFWAHEMISYGCRKVVTCDALLCSEGDRQLLVRRADASCFFPLHIPVCLGSRPEHFCLSGHGSKLAYIRKEQSPQLQDSFEASFMKIREHLKDMVNVLVAGKGKADRHVENWLFHICVSGTTSTNLLYACSNNSQGRFDRLGLTGKTAHDILSGVLAKATSAYIMSWIVIAVFCHWPKSKFIKREKSLSSKSSEMCK